MAPVEGHEPTGLVRRILEFLVFGTKSTPLQLLATIIRASLDELSYLLVTGIWTERMLWSIVSKDSTILGNAGRLAEESRPNWKPLRERTERKRALRDHRNPRISGFLPLVTHATYLILQEGKNV